MQLKDIRSNVISGTIATFSSGTRTSSLQCKTTSSDPKHSAFSFQPSPIRRKASERSVAGRQATGLLVHPRDTLYAAVIVIPPRIATAVARRSDHVGMRLHGDGPACRNVEATEMMVLLFTSSTVPLKPPWRPTDAGQMSDPSALRTLVYGAQKRVHWDRYFFLVPHGVLLVVSRASSSRLWFSALVSML